MIEQIKRGEKRERRRDREREKESEKERDQSTSHLLFIKFLMGDTGRPGGRLIGSWGPNPSMHCGVPSDSRHTVFGAQNG